MIVPTSVKVGIAEFLKTLVSHRTDKGFFLPPGFVLLTRCLFHCGCLVLSPYWDVHVKLGFVWASTVFLAAR